MPGAGKRWLSWEKHGVFWAGQRGGRSRESQHVHGVGDFGAEQTHKSTSEMMESRDLLKGPCGLKANGEKTKYFRHEARMSWERFVFSFYSTFFLQQFLFFVCCYFLFTHSNCFPLSDLLFCLVVSHPPRCQRCCGVSVQSTGEAGPS